MENLNTGKGGFECFQNTLVCMEIKEKVFVTKFEGEQRLAPIATRGQSTHLLSVLHYYLFSLS